MFSRENQELVTCIDGLCSFNITGRQLRRQHWYHCETCYPLYPNKGCCDACAEICHKGHKLSVGLTPYFFCDCGAGDCPIGQYCKCREKPKLIETPKEKVKSNIIESEITTLENDLLNDLEIINNLTKDQSEDIFVCSYFTDEKETKENEEEEKKENPINQYINQKKKESEIRVKRKNNKIPTKLTPIMMMARSPVFEVKKPLFYTSNYQQKMITPSLSQTNSNFKMNCISAESNLTNINFQTTSSDIVPIEEMPETRSKEKKVPQTAPVKSRTVRRTTAKIVSKKFNKGRPEKGRFRLYV
ncbi:hypothetical protein TRFO_41214 [Tritrichomonas foetus]|uniref:UBR-type domain-containing protein n=1 Tax=Tritrichomonas foetus TaxID=1144522 RepID=A0A1J4L106_9EUKA|nr:hypothetical protein TRFO_41214 [Tritrichomonas foetus]|eukprot:OHT17199.1 hypothetical protein TRFO_41214 [Tritrichomonas foetus]